MFCPYCGTPLNDDAVSCNACNSPVEPLEENATPAENQPDAVIESEQAPKKPKKLRSRLSKNLLTASILLLTLAAVVSLAIYLLPMLAGKGPSTALYIKDYELFTTRLDKHQPWQITDQLVEGETANISASNGSRYANLASLFTYLTEDSGTLFYPEQYVPGSKSATIYYRNIQNPADEPRLLDSDIVFYTVSPDGERVIYLKTDGTLFRYNSQGKEKIATNVSLCYGIPFLASEDCVNLIYGIQNDNGSYTVYYQIDGGKKEKLTSDCSTLYYANDNCTTIYYKTPKNKLYKATAGTDKKKIAYDVQQVFVVYETGALYYTTFDGSNATQKLTASQFVEDDVPQDASRNALRQQLESYFLNTYYADNICYFDGSKSHVLAENCCLSVDGNSFNYQAAADSPVLVYADCDITQIQKVKLSQVADMDALLEQISLNAAQARRIFVAAKNTVTEFQCDDTTVTAGNIILTADGTAGYYLSANGNGATNLYKVAITDGVPKKAVLYDTKVQQFHILDNDVVMYFKAVSDKKPTGDLYINQQTVDYEVCTDAAKFYYNADQKALLYYTNINKDNTNGTLKIWKDGKASHIADKVSAFQWVDKEVLYLTDYDYGTQCGTLHRFTKGVSTKVDTDVSYILASNDTFGLSFQNALGIR